MASYARAASTASRLPRVALVVPGLLEVASGVTTVALFLERVLRESGRYRAELISLPMSSRDESSVRLLSPATWRRGVLVRDACRDGLACRHVGAVWSELEFQRCRPRPPLTRLLRGYDAVQIVAGSPYWALLTRTLGRPVALQVATLVTEERREVLARNRGPSWLLRRLMTRIMARLDDRALDHADAVFVENRWMYDHVSARIGAARTVFAPPGVDTERYRPRRERSAPAPYILSVARFDDPRKKVSLLFEAYARLCDSMDHAPRLLLAGYAGPVDADLERARALGIRDRVEVRVDVGEDELVEIYRNASLFALASDEEGLGLVILEAMACGVPVVSTDSGGPSTLVVEGETGRLVPRGDPGALAAAMLRILADPELRSRMGRRARERAATHFSLEATGRRFLDVHDRLLASGTGNAAATGA